MTNPVPAFSVTSSSISVATSGPPASYTSIISGNHAVGTPNYVSSVNSQFPIQNSAITAGLVTTSVAGTVTTTGAWDFAYDIWFSSTPRPTTGLGNTSGSGLEMMIWLNQLGAIQPAGTAGPTVTIGGAAYTVWTLGTGVGPVSYVANTKVTSVTNLDLLPFINDAISRGLMTSSWYLIDVECGFEIWSGGAGLAITSFSCSNGVVSGSTTPAPHDTAAASDALTVAGRTGVLLVNDFNEGASGAIMTPANTGGTAENAFDYVTIDPTSTVAFAGATGTMAVTATQGGATANGTLVRVKVLTGAAGLTSQTGATGTQSGINVHQAPLTTTVTGSQVYAAMALGQAGPLTAAAGTTLFDNYQDTVNAQCYGTGRTSAATGTPGYVTVGASAPPGYGGGCAAAEILPSGTITEDPSSPAVAATTGGVTASTAPFSPPPGSLLVAMVATNWGAGVTTMTVTGGGLTWTELVSSNGSSQNYSGIWVAQVPPAAANAGGGQSGAFATGATAGRAGVTWSSSMGTLQEVFGRAYLYLTAYPAASDAIVQMRSSGVAACNIQVATTGNIVIQDSAYSPVYTFPAALPLNQWVRIEWDIVFTAVAGARSIISYYTSANSTTATAGILIENGNFGAAGCDEVDFGWTNVHPNQPVLYLDNLGISATGLLGPAATTVLLADAAGAADGGNISTALTLRNNADGGTNGTAVTAANSGGGSGTAWDTVTVASGAATFSAAQVAHGSLSYAFSTTAAGGVAKAGWAGSVGSQPAVFGRAYVYLTALPAVDDNVVVFSGSGGFGGGIMIASSGQLRLQNAGYAEIGGGPTLPTGQWVRLEWFVVAGAAGATSATVNYYASPDSTAITATVTDTAGAYGSAGIISAVNFGWNSSHPSQPVLYMDSIGLSAGGYLGPDVMIGYDAAGAADTLAIAGVFFPALTEQAGAADSLSVASSTAFVSLADTAGAAGALRSAGTGNTAGAVDSLRIAVSSPASSFGAAEFAAATDFMAPPAVTQGIAGADSGGAEDVITILQAASVPVPVAVPLAAARPAFIRSQMPRMHVQNILTGQWLHHDVQGISSPSVTWNLNQPDTFTCTLSPPRPDVIDSSGNPLFQAWRDAVYLEENDQIRYGGLITSGTQNGHQWALSAMGFAGYANGMPYDGPAYTEYNIDAGDAIRYLWDYIQDGVNSNLGLQVSPAKIGTLLGATVSNQAAGALTRTVTPDDVLTLPVGPASEPGMAVAYTFTALWVSNWAQGFSVGQDISIGGTEDARITTVVTYAGHQTGEIHINGTLSHHHVAGEQVRQLPTNTKLSRAANAGQNSIFIGNPLGFSAGQVILFRGNKTYTIQSIITNAAGNPTGQVTLTYNLSEHHSAGELVVQAPTPFQLLWWNTPDCGSEIASIQAEAIFDWHEQHTWTSAAKEGVVHQLRFGVPRIGGRRSDLRFAEGENITHPVQVTQGGAGYADSIIVLGSGSGSAQIRTGASQPSGHLRRVQVYANQTMTTVARAASIGRRVLAAAEAAIDGPTQVVVMNHPNAPFGSFGCGDDIPVTIVTGWRNTVFWVRITSIQQDPTTNVATLTVARSDSFSYADQSGIAGTI